MIDLSNYGKLDVNLKSSKGDQSKWLVDNIWYKADENGYESLSEYVVSKLLSKSSLHNEEYVMYDLVDVKYKNQVYHCCRSDNFLLPGDNLITIERLYMDINGQSLTETLNHIDGYKNRAKYLVNFVIDVTELNDFGEYLYKTLVIDALFLNEDRHLHNIAVVRKANGTFDYCPIFDNGASLLSNVKVDYPLNIDTLDLIRTVKAKTIGDDFIEAINEMEASYGTSISFSFDEKDIDELLKDIDVYDSKIIKRVKQVLKYQRNKMMYYF